MKWLCEVAMLDKIEALKKQVDELEEYCKEWEREFYKRSTHNVFAVGDWVTDGKYVGVVGWVKNERLDIKVDDGFFGLDIKNGDLGFRGPCRRDDFRLLDDEEVKYYTTEKEYILPLTGEEINDLLYRIGRSNGSKATEKLKRCIT